MAALAPVFFLVWLGLIAATLPVAYFALKNFKKGIDPLWDLRTQTLTVFGRFRHDHRTSPSIAR